MYNLIVDAGNSSIKLFVFDDEQFVNRLKCKNLEDMLQVLTAEYQISDFKNCIISSVSVDSEKIAEIFRPLLPTLVFSTSLNLPINIRYSTPDTLGSDRVAAVVGAVSLFPERNILVIDSGTAITYDIVNAKGEYLGGNISVGLKSRFLAMHNFTHKLPLLKVDKSLNGLYGTNTTEALTLGIQNGMRYEVEENIRAFSRQFEDLLVVFTGGDSFFFENINFCSIFTEPNLVAVGLNKILKCNV